MADMDITEFLATRLGELEATAHYAGPARIAWLTYRDSDGQMDYTTVAADGGADEGGPWIAAGKELPEPASVCVVYDPAAVLADIEAKRQLLELAFQADQIEEALHDEVARRPVPGDVSIGDRIRRVLAVPFASHPDYNPSWRPEP